MTNWLKRLFTTHPSEQWEFKPLPVHRLEFSDDERRLFDMLPPEEQLAFARQYFKTYPARPDGILTHAWIRPDDWKGLP